MSFMRLHDVWVEFPIYQGGGRSLKKALLANTTHGNLMEDAFHRITVTAVRECTLHIEDGDRLAVIGHNGAGKSTLLKVLAGIYQATRGWMETSGKVTALLTASLGLNAEATGRENIIMRGMFMGVHPRDMEAKIDDVAEFTELGAYLDMPVRTYSSGMMVRLSFAASTAIAPQILLMDEWLSAGDASFLSKAQNRIEKFVGHSSILVLASHSMELLEQWCNRAILLDHGRIVASGDVKSIIEAYHALDTGA